MDFFINNPLNNPNIKDFYDDGEVVYYNPRLGILCDDYVSENSLTGAKRGCLKWYIINDKKGATKVNLLLDHNITDRIAFSEENGTSPSTTFLNELKESTKDWILTPNITSSYASKNYNIDYTEYKARLIQAEEIAKIIKNNSFNKKTSSDINIETYSWLTLGEDYYTITMDEGTNVWKVKDNSLMKESGSLDSGIRPVIELYKVDINDPSSSSDSSNPSNPSNPGGSNPSSKPNIPKNLVVNKKCVVEIEKYECLDGGSLSADQMSCIKTVSASESSKDTAKAVVSSYVCPSGYSASGTIAKSTMCSKETTAACPSTHPRMIETTAEPIYSGVPENACYNIVTKTGICPSTHPYTTKTSPNCWSWVDVTCPDGGTPFGNRLKCEDKVPSKVSGYVCPSGYSASGTITKDTVCEKETVNVTSSTRTYESTPKYTCSNGASLKYTVVFDSNGGTGTMDNQTIYYGTKTLLNSSLFSKNNYVFVGWSTSKKSTTAIYKNKEEVLNLIEPSEIVTLYAIWAKVSTQQFVKLGTNKSIYSYFVSENVDTAKSSCIDTSKSNAEVTNVSSLTAGSHNISCIIKTTDNLVTNATSKISVLDYGRYTYSYYAGALYYGTSSGIAMKTITSSYSKYSKYSGNYSDIWRFDNLRNKKLSYEYIHDYRGSTHSQDYIYAGDREYPLKYESDYGKWIQIYYLFNWGTGYLYLGNLKLYFEDGNSYTVNQAISNGYVEPIVFATSIGESNGFSKPFGNFMNILSGGNTDSANLSIAYIVFKLTENHKLTKISFYSSLDANRDYGDGLYVWQYDGNLSYQSW